MNYFNFILTVLCVYLYLVEVSLDNTIQCPHAKPHSISHNELSIQFKAEGYWVNKYFAPPEFIERIPFPRFGRLSRIRYTPIRMTFGRIAYTVTMLTSASPESLDVDYYYYKLRADSNKPIFEIEREYLYKRIQNFDGYPDFRQPENVITSTNSQITKFKFALVYIDDESHTSFSIYQSCDGKYAWAQIEDNTVKKYLSEGKDPFAELKPKIDAVMSTLKIKEAIIHDTALDHLLSITKL